MMKFFFISSILVLLLSHGALTFGYLDRIQHRQTVDRYFSSVTAAVSKWKGSHWTSLGMSEVEDAPAITTQRSSPPPSGWTPESTRSPRVQKLKDAYLLKKVVRDITAAEFALKLEAGNQQDIIDFERLINKLDADSFKLARRVSLPTSEQQRLLVRVGDVREQLVARTARLEASGALANATSSSIESKSSEESADGDNPVLNVKELTDNLQILIREDGTVDWDGAIASGKEVAKFGQDLWERLNGREEGTPSISEMFSPVSVQLPSNAEIELLTDLSKKVTNQMQLVEANRASLARKLRQDRRESKAIPKKEISRLQLLDQQVKELNKILRLVNLNLDMEKICAYLQQELESALEEPIAQRSLLAEVTLIDKQLVSIMTGIDFKTILREESLVTMIGEADDKVEVAFETSRDVQPDLDTAFSNRMDAMSVSSDVMSGENGKIVDIISLIDNDELSLIIAEVSDLKMRLGLDAQLLPVMDWGSFGTVAAENLNKVQAGLTFFGDGTALLAADVQYAWQLLLKAVQGTTLIPREVNAIRRTVKDLLTLIPFTIILIIPLSPVGHVLVFSFIQRFFPEFFPSCYTEKRLNLKRLFMEVERKDDEDLLLGEDSRPISSAWGMPLSDLVEKYKFRNIFDSNSYSSSKLDD